MNGSEQEFWEKYYTTHDATQMGWYEECPEQSLKLIEKCNLDPFDIIMDVGSGASTLVDHLLQLGYRQVIATDFCEPALQISQNRLGNHSNKVRWIVDDLLKPVQLKNFTNVSLWHDRAVLHFLTHPEQRNAYFKTLDSVVKVNGFVIIAAFAEGGANNSGGHDVVQYNDIMISKLLGNHYRFHDVVEYTCTTPNGESRPYIYTRFERIE